MWETLSRSIIHQLCKDLQQFFTLLDSTHSLSNSRCSTSLELLRAVVKPGTMEMEMEMETETEMEMEMETEMEMV